MPSFFKVDVHTHILPEVLPDFGSEFGYGDWIHLRPTSPTTADMMLGDRFFRAIECNCYKPTTRLHDCAKTGVDVQVLSTVPVMFSYWAKPEHGLRVARYLNDDLAETIRKYPKRFVGLGTVPLQAPEMAVEELKRCMNELGMRGVQIGSHVNEWNLDAPELDPFWAAAEALDAAIFVHPWDMDNSTRMKKYWFPWLIGMPSETTIAICSMIFGGVLERFPKLKVCFAHGGGSFPGTVARIEHGFNVRPDLCQTVTKINPTSYLGKIYVDSLVHDKETLDFLISKMKASRIMLGSDYPFPLGEHCPGKMIEEMENIDDETKNQLLSKTAFEFLGLDPNDFAREPVAN